MAYSVGLILPLIQQRNMHKDVDIPEIILLHKTCSSPVKALWKVLNLRDLTQPLKIGILLFMRLPFSRSNYLYRVYYLSTLLESISSFNLKFHGLCHVQTTAMTPCLLIDYQVLVRLHNEWHTKNTFKMRAIIMLLPIILN